MADSSKPWDQGGISTDALNAIVAKLTGEATSIVGALQNLLAEEHKAAQVPANAAPAADRITQINAALASIASLATPDMLNEAFLAFDHYIDDLNARVNALADLWPPPV
jgi:hypothetical protein